MNTPLVTVICVCYNHAQYVTEALNSVAGQTYNNIELIVIDDGSTDGSPKIVKQWIASHPVTVLLLNGTNLGYCKTFNKAFKLAKGEFIIDFAADDVMMPDKIRSQVDFFSKLDRTYGVIFSDAEYIDEKGIYIRDHFKYLIGKRLLKSIPQGNVYADVLDKYFIPAPTMLSRVEVYRELGGYDEDLAYEDFDFWIRSSRYFKYGFQNEKLMKIRRTAKSMSSGWYTRNDPQLLSTYQICKKARKLNHDDRDWQAWVKRVRYELRQSVFSENHTEAKLFLQLLREDNQQNWQDQCIYWIDSFKLPLAILRRWYHQIWFHSFK
jgi:glycosyltransferase involved in cell wall biosynthesis